MAPGFRALDDPQLKKTGSVEYRFTREFPGCAFPRKNYYKLRAVFHKAGEQVQEEFIKAGRTSKGSWAEFVKKVAEGGNGEKKKKEKKK